MLRPLLAGLEATNSVFKASQLETKRLRNFLRSCQSLVNLVSLSLRRRAALFPPLGCKANSILRRLQMQH